MQVDDVWSTPGVLHLRVPVMDNQGRWRHRYYPAVSLDSIPIEAVAPLLAYFAKPEADDNQMLLFDA